jgi:hypothetical protein
MKQLNESLNYMDMEDQITPLLGIDEYKSKLGEDAEVITLSFSVDSKEAGEDLVIWLERGYEFIIDAELSPGQVERGKYYVFVEMNRRPSSPRKIMEILDDLETLTGLKSDDWSIKVDRDRYPATQENIQRYIPLTANDYRAKHETELNEWREIAGLKTAKTVVEVDEDIRQMQRQAGIY